MTFIDDVRSGNALHAGARTQLTDAVFGRMRSVAAFSSVTDANLRTACDAFARELIDGIDKPPPP